MNLIDYIDSDEGRNYPMSNACYNCGAKSSNGTWLTPVAIEGSILENAWACDDCMEEQQRVERAAEQLAALPSCDSRQAIVDRPDLTVQRLVNLLTVHDFQCEACASTRKTVQSDRLYVSPAAVCCEGRVA